MGGMGGMPGMEGMGGMGGDGGFGGIDFSKLGGGAGGMPDMGDMGDMGDEGGEGGDDDDEMPELEDEEQVGRIEGQYLEEHDTGYRCWECYDIDPLDRFYSPAGFCKKRFQRLILSKEYISTLFRCFINTLFPDKSLYCPSLHLLVTFSTRICIPRPPYIHTT
ncbi:hypothetical protein BDR22DRAFT_605054 [Usnea florida]